MDRLKHALGEATGWLLFLSFLMLVAVALPPQVFDPESKHFIMLIGLIGVWRYSMGIIHFLRGMLFLYVVYPYYRRKVEKLGKDADPSHVFLMVTSFRIDALTTGKVYGSVIKEAINCGYPTTVVCSIVEMSDELLIKSLWEKLDPPDRVKLDFVRIAGTGKRDGLANGFRAISRHMPDEDAVVAVIDGDTVLNEGVVRKTVPLFQDLPQHGWPDHQRILRSAGRLRHERVAQVRFAQRHINMCSMALSHRVLTLTGRMSVFRAVVTDPEFIVDVENDNLDHWRLGRFKFLTGDDKSSWFSLMRLGYDTFYVPDASIHTVEHPPEKRFVKASRKLMFRWYGNNLRQNSRALKLGVQRLGWFTSVVLFDQRVSMWTSLLGLTVAIIGSIKYSIAIFIAYLLWVCSTRLVLTLLLSLSGHPIGPAYPLILYYNQIVGAVVKIHVFFRLDQQSWTRQDTKLNRELASFQSWFNNWSSKAMTFSATSIFIAVLMLSV
uniref:Glycosyltransferase alg8 n=1 Tax=Azotobacter vinelandii TaxID=354 RepID=ALG8_AZOVI|nr:RecName: Full=Glycosyltransferase alg8 [Azotobacter vinelandii]CAA70053.1 glucosyl transferase [Azotobacter vinelandii]